MSGEVMAFDIKRTTNAQAILDCAKLGYLRDTDVVLDTTFRTGRFWKMWQPGSMWANDLDPEFGDHHFDFRALPPDWQGWFDVVVFDPDYKLAGNSKDHQAGSGTLNADYGMDRDYKPVDELMESHRAGFAECVRVCKPKGHILYKTMDQVVSGKKRWLSSEFPQHRLVDELYVVGYRKQPADRECPECQGVAIVIDGCVRCDATGRIQIPQKHARQNFSVLQIYQRSK